MSASKSRKKRSLGQMRVASIGALSVTLFLLGAIALIRILASGVEREVKEQLTFDIELPAGYTAESYQLLARELPQIKGIAKQQYISADQALEQIIPRLGEDPRELLGYNPLSPVIRINIAADYLQVDSLKQLQTALTALGLDAAGLGEQQSEQLSKMNRNITSIEWVLWGVLLLQVIFTLIQINNTTRLGIYAERLKIRTLTLVGATPWFIRRPLVWRSLVDATVASIVALGMLSLAVYAVELSLGSAISSMLDPRYVLGAIVGLLLFALVACGSASYRATQRYIRMDGSRIHLI
ncbi:MAG: permease-like cell division protein FtsX [Porphyromonas sp.]|nr:permease-like cell division protein FtsX [Porphyromonas sp.]